MLFTMSNLLSPEMSKMFCNAMLENIPMKSDDDKLLAILLVNI